VKGDEIKGKGEGRQGWGSHDILVLKFKDFSRTLKLHFEVPILNGNLQHGQY